MIRTGTKANTRWARTLTILGAGALLASACTSEDARAQGKQAQRQADSAAVMALPEVLATVGDQAVTLGEVRARAGDQLDQLDMQYRRERDRIVQAAVESLVRERVLAAEAGRQGVAVDQLVVREAGGNLDPSPADVARWYDENRNRLGGRTLAELAPQIADFLRTQKREQALVALERRLGREQRVVYHFEPYRIEFELEGVPMLGAADAPVTLVEFSDFQCPYCRTFYPRLYDLEKEFRGKLRIAFLQFPLTSIHPHAFKAAEASLCAHDQGKFWQMHNELFEDQQRLAPEQLKQTAQKVGLAAQSFDSCLDMGKYAGRVNSELLLGSRSGVSGTPALFLNGAFLEGGALPYEALAAAVRKELDRLEH